MSVHSAHLACVLAIAAALATGCAEHVQLLMRGAAGGDRPYTFWPPPASTSVWMGDARATPSARSVSFGEAAERIASALKTAGYVEARWYRVGARYDHGFVVTTRLEHIASNGSPALGPARWLPTLTDACELRWLVETRELRLHAPAGRYRALLLAFTDLPRVHQPHRAWEWSERTVMSGPDLPAADLPAARRASPAFRLGVYVYEYAADSSDDELRFVPVDEKLDVGAHVERAGLGTLRDLASGVASIGD